MYPWSGCITGGSHSSAVIPHTTLVSPILTTVPKVVLERLICETVTWRDSSNDRPDGRMFRSR